MDSLLEPEEIVKFVTSPHAPRLLLNSESNPPNIKH